MDVLSRVLLESSARMEHVSGRRITGSGSLSSLLLIQSCITSLTNVRYHTYKTLLYMK